jgi:hypothetical protein
VSAARPSPGLSGLKPLLLRVEEKKYDDPKKIFSASSRAAETIPTIPKILKRQPPWTAWMILLLP